MVVANERPLDENEHRDTEETTNKGGDTDEEGDWLVSLRQEGSVAHPGQVDGCCCSEV